MRVFVRIVETGSFTAAAQSFNTTTGVMSRAVSELEHRLRTRLLNRSTRRLALTPAGARYLQRCQQILADIDHAEEEASSARERLTGTLRIRSFSSIGQHYVLPAISRYRARYPEVVVDLTLSQSARDLFGGGSDVAIVKAPSLSDSAMVSHVLGSTCSILCASTDYVRSRAMPQQPGDLAQHDCLTLNTPSFPGCPPDVWLLEGPDSSETIQVRGPFQVNNPDSLAVAIREGIGIGVLPLYAAAEGLRNGTLVRVLPNHTLQNTNIYALYPSRKFLDAKTRTWVEFLRTHLPAVIARDQTLLDGDRRAETAAARML